MNDVRERVLEFAFNPLAKTLLIEGPVGAGKSTLARAVGMVKRVAPLVETEARVYARADVVRFDESRRIDLRSMPWYVELSLTGLVENLADVQLFGSIEGAFTGATDRPGIFEQAMTGRMRRGKEEPGALLTNGVVFLDEIGDLGRAQQAKLLPVLSGGVFYRVGAEGKANHELQFAGTTIAATWRAPTKVLREDLYSRLSAHRIRLPGLTERAEDFHLILDQLEEMTLNAAKKEIARMMRVEQATLDRGYWQERSSTLKRLSDDDRKLLSRVDWSERGNMRGLSGAVERVLIGGRSVQDALPDPTEGTNTNSQETGLPSLLDGLLRSRADGQGLAGHLRAIEVEQRRKLREHLLSDHGAKQRVAETLGLDEATISQQLHQLDRVRRRRRGGKVK